LSNVELIAADISEYNPDNGAFDYVICHGVYSWVSNEIQKRILQLLVRSLAPQGVCLISYNTLPGWRQRGTVRDVLQVGSLASSESDDVSRYESGMRLLTTLAGEATMLPEYVRQAAARLTQSEPSYVVQEFLGEHNAPVLFVDFMRAAQDVGLQFVTEARVVMMSADDLSPTLNELLDSFGEDIWMREQVLDLVRNRTFRETILCHQSLLLNRGLSTKAFKELVFVANYIPVRYEANGDDAEVRLKERSSDREVVTPRGECERVLEVVAQYGARGVELSNLVELVKETLQISEHDVMRNLVTLWKTGFVDALQISLCNEASDQLVVSVLARAQALSGEKVTSFLHESFDLPVLERRALALVEKPTSKRALSTLLLQHAPQDQVDLALSNLEQKGFFR
jgi:methyltransferase-like protein